MLKLKLQYFSHLMWRVDSLEKTLMLGKIKGKRRRGQQRMRCLDSITDSIDVKWNESHSVMSDSFHGLYIIHGIFQARILEWVVFPFSRGSSQPRDQTQVSSIAGRFFTSWATREAPVDMNLSLILKTVKDRGAWCAAVRGVTESETTEWLNNSSKDARDHLTQSHSTSITHSSGLGQMSSAPENYLDPIVSF